jgi:hypothetical protein
MRGNAQLPLPTAAQMVLAVNRGEPLGRTGSTWLPN